MHVVGGTYIELCEMPSWNAEFGSGGRAAAAISALSPGSTLHTYARDPHTSGITFLKTLGLNVIAHPSNVSLAFAYFHPLSRPHIQPPIGTIDQQPSFLVAGETVLRFGFLEGDAVVDADRAIFDPQTVDAPRLFSANGSKARSLALVMNEHELATVAGTADIAVAAKRVMSSERATVLVVKAGARGATVFDSTGNTGHIPAYYSTSVFKIGTGDVFSATFAYYWGEAGLSGAAAADLASRSVAAYCSTRQLPIPTGSIPDLRAVISSLGGTILLEGLTNTLGRRYTMEEARYRIVELGATVISPTLEPALQGISQNIAAVLVIADGMEANLSEPIRAAQNFGRPIVLLAEDRFDGIVEELTGSNIIITSDFSSAIYFSLWASMA